MGIIKLYSGPRVVGSLKELIHIKHLGSAWDTASAQFMLAALVLAVVIIILTASSPLGPCSLWCAVGPDAT